jgi:hypothetical protein
VLALERLQRALVDLRDVPGRRRPGARVGVLGAVDRRELLALERELVMGAE